MARKKIDEVIKKAKEYGLGNDYLFTTTLSRYQTQIKILEGLKKAIEDEDVLVTKEYVKGRGNLYTHPAIAEYNKTTDSANKTVETLNKIINTRVASKADNSANPILEAMNL